MKGEGFRFWSLTARKFFFFFGRVGRSASFGARFEGDGAGRSFLKKCDDFNGGLLASVRPTFRGNITVEKKNLVSSSG